MGKLVPALMATGGATAVSVGGVCLARNSGTGSVDQEPSAGATSIEGTASTGDQQPTAASSFEFEDLSSFISNPKKSPCVTSYFPNLEKEAQAQTIDGTNKPADSEFFKTSSVDVSPIQSCLKIEHKKTTYSGDKWNGKFTWLWAFISGDEGFVTFNVAESSNVTSENMKFSGIFYLVGKNASATDKWEIKYKKQVDNKDVDSQALSTHFPKASSDLKVSVDGEYWGLVDDEEKLKKSCKTNECGNTANSGPTFVSKKLTWTKGTDDKKKLSGWSSSSTWWSNIYGLSNWNLTYKIDKFSGAWAVDNS